MDFTEKYNLLPEEYKTAREIGLASATLGALVRRGLAEVKNTTPKQYKKNNNPLITIYMILEENKDDYDTYFTIRKANQKIGMLCSFENGVVLDCWGNSYDLTDVNKIELRTKKFDI